MNCYIFHIVIKWEQHECLEFKAHDCEIDVGKQTSEFFSQELSGQQCTDWVKFNKKSFNTLRGKF